jgi:hypothetical protein
VSRIDGAAGPATTTLIVKDDRVMLSERHKTGNHLLQRSAGSSMYEDDRIRASTRNTVVEANGVWSHDIAFATHRRRRQLCN